MASGYQEKILYASLGHDLVEAERLAKEALEAGVADTETLAVVHHALGLAAIEREDYQTAKDHFHRAVTLGLEVDPTPSTMLALNHMYLGKSVLMSQKNEPTLEGFDYSIARIQEATSMWHKATGEADHFEDVLSIAKELRRRLAEGGQPSATATPKGSGCGAVILVGEMLAAGAAVLLLA